MTRGPVEEALLVQIRRAVLRAYGIVRAEPPEIERAREVPTDVLAHLDEPAERALGTG